MEVWGDPHGMRLGLQQVCKSLHCMDHEIKGLASMIPDALPTLQFWDSRTPYGNPRFVFSELLLPPFLLGRQKHSDKVSHMPILTHTLAHVAAHTPMALSHPGSWST